MERRKEKWKKIARGYKKIPNIYEIGNQPLKAGLCCLYISKNVFKEEFFSLSEIEKILTDYLDLPISLKQLQKSFARAGKKVIKEEDKYKISYFGEKYLENLPSRKAIKVIYIRSDHPISAFENLAALITSIKRSNLLIIDPYYGINTLKVLKTFAEYHNSVKFLTSQLGSGEREVFFHKTYRDLKKELGSKLEIRLFPKKTELHDRYILVKDVFFIIGHGLKDLGNKESLIIAIEDRYGKDIRKILEKSFHKRWSISQIL